MGGVNVEDGRRGLMHRYPKCTFLKECNFNFIGRYASRAKKKTQLDSICNPFVCLPYISEIIHWFIICSPHVRESKTVLGCVPLRWSGSVIRDHLDHGRLTEPMNPCPKWIGQLNWFTMIRVISDHWFWSGLSQTNVPLEILDSAVDSGF